MTGTHALYRFYGRGEQLLYVGITRDPLTRWSSHERTKDWWHEVATITIETHPDRARVLQAEREAIRKERPLYNVVHNRDRCNHAWTHPNFQGSLVCSDCGDSVSAAPPRSSADPVIPWGVVASDMPDDCARCNRSERFAIYYPHAWQRGEASYECSSGHRWTCGWGHDQSGSDARWRGTAVQVDHVREVTLL